MVIKKQIFYFLYKTIDILFLFVYNNLVKLFCFTRAFMILEKSVRLCLLNDFYGNLLTKNQQAVLDSYLNYNMPLTEISASLNITRQGVLDTIKKATAKLEDFEQKLGMLNKYLKQLEIVESAKNINDKTLKKLMDVWDSKGD